MIDHRWMLDPGDDPRMDQEQPDHPGLSLSEQYPGEFEEPLPFEDNCTVGGEHAHCEIHDMCIEPGSDCPVCLEMERASHFDFDGAMDARDRIWKDPVAGHHPDCQCERCRIGNTAWLWLHHPEDF